MSQPEWKTLWCADYELVQEDTTGVYDPEMEVAEEIEEGRFEVYRFSLDRFKLVDDPDPDEGTVPAKLVVPFGYDSSWALHPSRYREWFIDDLASVANCVGSTEQELIAALCSEDVRARAGVYVDIGSCHGFMNLDGYPLTLTEQELDERWDC